MGLDTHLYILMTIALIGFGENGSPRVLVAIIINGILSIMSALQYI